MHECKGLALIFFICSGAVYSHCPNGDLGWSVDFEKNRCIYNSRNIFEVKAENAENLTRLFAPCILGGEATNPRYDYFHAAALCKMPNEAGSIFHLLDSTHIWLSKGAIIENCIAGENGNSETLFQSKLQASELISDTKEYLPEIRFITHPEIPGRDQIFIAPLVGWNLYNGFMFGLGLFNHKMIERPTQISIMPLWGELSNSLAGQFHISHKVEPGSRFFQNVQLGAYGRRYSSFSDMHAPACRSFHMIKGFVNARLQLPERRIGDVLTVFFNSHFIQRYQPGRGSHAGYLVSLSYFINQFGVNYVNTTATTPFDYQLELEQGPRFLKTTARAQFFLHYNSSRRGGLLVRFFGGAFLQTPPADSPFDFRLRLGALRGVHDYTFSRYFLGRSERMGTLTGNQITESQSGFSFPTSVGQTWQWLTTVNLKADVPRLPFRLFFDAGTYAGAAKAFEGSQRISWVAGVHFEPIRHVLRINFPVAVSSDINQVASFAFDRYIQRVTYSIYFDRLNFWKFLHTRRLRDLFPEDSW